MVKGIFVIALALVENGIATARASRDGGAILIKSKE